MGSELERPKEMIWASDATYGSHPGEPWTGEDNKKEPSSGDFLDGYRPGLIADATEWNWWRNFVCYFAQFFSGIQLANWNLGDFSGVTLGASGWCGSGTYPAAACYDDSLECFTCLDRNGETIYSHDPTDGAATPAMGGQGMVWENETTNPRTLGYAARDIACDNDGNRIAINGVSSIMVLRSNALNSWATQAAASSAVWKCVDHDHGGGLWAVGGAGGALDTSPNASSWTARTSGVSGDIITLKHNQEMGDDARWVGLTTTQCIWSSDGITWSYASHGLSTNPLETKLAYNKESKRWIALLVDEDIAYSDNQGQTWTQVNDPFGLGSVTLNYHRGYIDSDGQDGWIFHYCPDATTAIQERHVSKDNGVTWHRVYEGMVYKGMAKWGTDGFICVGFDDCSYSVRLLGT